ncbi:TolC family protein [Flammeovirga pectinis]|nr:TolC family protein [Flammeovirga pectinis]
MKNDNQSLENMRIPEDWVLQPIDSSDINLDWAKEWETEVLASLIEEAYKFNADIYIAASRIEQANKGLVITSAQMLPIFGAGASGGYNFPTSGARPSTASVNMSWEIDLWGKVRYAKQGQRTTIYSTEYAKKKLQQVLAASIAKSWYLAICIQEQKELLDTAIVATQEMASLNEARFQIGIAKESDVLQMNAQEAKFKERLAKLNQLDKDIRRSIELLLGRYPAGELDVAMELIEMSSTLPQKLPMSMLENRPDVLISQYAIQKAFYNKEVAKAARWPQISLTSQLMGVNSAAQAMFQLSNPIFTIGGNLVTPLFSWGAIKANIAIKGEDQKQAVAYYAKTYLNALSEVETSLNALNAVDSRFEQSTIALENLKRTYELSELQYKVGNENMFTLLQKQLQLLNESTNQTNLRCEKIVERVNLYLALGGDYTPAN